MLAFTGCRELLGTADWASQRDLIRALVKRVEVAHNEVHVVFRIDPYPSDNDPEKKRLQLCRGRGLVATGESRQEPDDDVGFAARVHHAGLLVRPHPLELLLSLHFVLLDLVPDEPREGNKQGDYEPASALTGPPRTRWTGCRIGVWHVDLAF